MPTFLIPLKRWLLRNPRVNICIVFIAIIALALSLIYTAKPQLQSKSIAAFVPSVHTLQVQANDQRFTIQARGLLKPAQEVQLISQVTGKIIYLSDNFITGANFKQGDILLRVDPAIAELELQNARTQLAQAKLREMELEANLRATSSLGQQGHLSPLAQGKPQQALAKSSVGAAEAAVRLAEQQLQQTTLRAPFDGRVFLQGVQLHEQLAPGMPIAQIYTNRRYLVRIPITQQQLPFIEFAEGPNKGSKISVSDAITGLQLHGHIIRSEGHVAQNRLIYLIAELDELSAEQQLRLLPGSLVNIAISSRLIANVIAIPDYTLHANNVVWLLNDENRLQITPVEVLYRTHDTVYLRSGLKASDKLITSHIAALTDSMRLHDLDAADSAPAASAVQP